MKRSVLLLFSKEWTQNRLHIFCSYLLLSKCFFFFFQNVSHLCFDCSPVLQMWRLYSSIFWINGRRTRSSMNRRRRRWPFLPPPSRKSILVVDNDEFSQLRPILRVPSLEHLISPGAICDRSQPHISLISCLASSTRITGPRARPDKRRW